MFIFIDEAKLDWYLEAYSLEYTKRYSMKRIVHQESVAAHSYFVCLGLMLLSDEFEFDIGVALQMAVAHDIPEMSISDVNHKVKQRHRVLAEVIKQAEVSFMNECNWYRIRLAYFAHLDNTRESDFVRLADALQCWQYAKTEQLLGNVAQMQEVLDSSEQRVAELYKVLAQYRK